MGHSSLVSTSWLAEHLDDPSLVIIDGSFKLPGVTPSAREDYIERHIPGAVFFDIDAIADHASPLPHMLPDAETYARAAEALGMSDDSVVVVYDAPGLMSAGRVWWTLRAFGHRRVAVLDGGLKAWMDEGRPVTAEQRKLKPGKLNARLDAHAVVSKADVLANIASQERQLIDARSAARFQATEKEARPGLRSGHVPGSINLPFNLLTDPQTARIRPQHELRGLFQGVGVDFGRPVIASCGSGVTACALVFGLHLLGNDDVAVYDGSWTEWGMPGDTPVETGEGLSAHR